MNVDGIVPGKFEPSLTMVVLRKCASCGEKHPMAHTPPVDSAVCLACGAPVAAPEPHAVKQTTWVNRLLERILK